MPTNPMNSLFRSHFTTRENFNPTFTRWVDPEIFPYGGRVQRAFAELSARQRETAPGSAATLFAPWRRTTFAERAAIAAKVRFPTPAGLPRSEPGGPPPPAIRPATTLARILACLHLPEFCSHRRP